MNSSGGGGGVTAAAPGSTAIMVNSNNTTTINNNHNNVMIKFSFGCEDMEQISVEDKRMIMNNGYNSLIKLIETVHLNENYKQFQNVCIPNLKDKYAKCYDKATNRFVTREKSELIEEIISFRTSNLKEIHNEYNRNTKLHNNVLSLIHKLEKYRPENERNDEIFQFYRELCRDITLLVYNKSKSFQKK